MRFWRWGAGAFLVCCALGLTTPALAANEGDAEAKLQQVREALRGENKQSDLAKKLLLEIVESETKQKTLDISELCYAYVYLGYIADRAGQRDGAISWYKRALPLEQAGSGIRQCAVEGLKRPLTWIRHLDHTNPGSSSPQGKTLTPHKGYVTTGEPPKDLVPATSLSPKERQENFDFLCDAVDKTYACFDLKGIKWPEVCQRYRSQLVQTQTAEDFYRLVFALVNELKDTHSWLQNYKVPLPSSGPGLTVDLVEGRFFIVAVDPQSGAARAGMRAGAEVLKIDEFTVQERIERLKNQLPGRSTERAFQREAARYLLAGDKGTSFAVTLRSPEAPSNEVHTLKRTQDVWGAPPSRTCPFEMMRQKFVHFGRHASGPGYIRLDSFNGREEIATEFDRALEALSTTPALILDIRGNPGGFGIAQPHIVGRFITNRTLVSIGYRKNGPAHHDLKRYEEHFSLAGNWQYTRPVALLIDDETGSAADLFACYMRSTGRVLTIGTTTHGNLAGVAAYTVLPCGLIVRISNGYVSDASDRPIEGNGNEPTTIGDILNGRDPVLDKSVALLLERITQAINNNR